MTVVTRPPRDGLVRALPSLTLRAAEADEPDEVEEPGETPAEEAAEEAEERGMPTLEGHFLRFNAWTEINSYYEGTFLESIAPGAVKKTLVEGRDSIRCLFQHGMDFYVGDKPLGPQTSEEDGEGAHYSVPLLDTHYNRDLIPGLAAGLYGASFCFTVIREDFNEEPEPSDYNPKGMPERVLREIRVLEFGPVSFPAYDDASAELSSKGMRSMTDELLAEQLRRDPERLGDILERAARPQELAMLLERRGVRAIGRLPRTAALETEERIAEGDGQPKGPGIEATPDGTVHTLTSREPGEDAPAALEGDRSQVPGGAAVTVTLEGDASQLARSISDAIAGQSQTAEPSEAHRSADEGDEPEAAHTQDPAPPEGADPDGHPQPGRRDQNPTSDAPAASDKKGNPMTLEELRARQEAIRSRLVEIGEEHGDAELPEDTQTEYDGLQAERSGNETKITGIEARQAEVRSLARNPEARESGDGAGAHFNVTPEHDDPYDFEAVATRARSATSGEQRARIMQDAALRAVDQEKVFFHDRVDMARAKTHIEYLVRREALAAGGELRSEAIAERIMRTGSEFYHRSFVKAMGGAPLTSEEQRALATFTGSAGGFAVPYTLDPTLIPTSNYSVNPFRGIARTETIVASNEWKGVTSGAVTVAYAAEAAQATDNTPTLAQPTAQPERCQAWIPFSLEAEGDWPAALTEMAGLIAEGKDDVEATKFLLGAGHASNEPEGLLTGATEVVKTKTAKTFVIADFYALEEALAARFRPRGQFVGGRFVYNKIRQFDTAGGAGLWLYLPQGIGNNVPTPGTIEPNLAGYPVHECSTYDAELETAKKLLTIGDFRHFLIVDRVGMNIELVPTVFGANQRPTGQRGIYAFWRNTSKVLVKAAFKTLEVT